jgi:phosphoglycolate phosphatase
MEIMVLTPRLLLFDIDGTLLLSGGAGVRSMNLAFEKVFGITEGFTGIPLSGRTDSFLVSQALQRANLDDSAAHHARLRETYLGILSEEIEQPGTGRKQVLPGVRELLEAITPNPLWHVGLLTGNYEPAARTKLRYFALDGFFSWGAFGEDAADRDELARIAVARSVEHNVPAEARRNAIVIGDTPHDVACARAASARAIAVATGGCTIEELTASQPDVLLADLRDTEAILRLL